MMGELDMSPYQILFGRDRSVPGLPYTPMRECEAATQYFTRMELLDLTLSTKLNGLHAQQNEAVNKKRTKRPAFGEGDMVWVLRAPTMSSSAKLEPRWKGPMKVTQRRGESSYEVVDPMGFFMKSIWTR